MFVSSKKMHFDINDVFAKKKRKMIGVILSKSRSTLVLGNILVLGGSACAPTAYYCAQVLSIGAGVVRRKLIQARIDQALN